MNSSRSYSLAALPRLLYTQNPFYLISALLVLYGIYVALGPESGMDGGWLLLGLLGGYTLALTLAGLVIVRFGQVWDDARHDPAGDYSAVRRAVGGLRPPRARQSAGGCAAIDPEPRVCRLDFRRRVARFEAAIEKPVSRPVLLDSVPPVLLSDWLGTSFQGGLRRDDAAMRVSVSRRCGSGFFDTLASGARGGSRRTFVRLRLDLALVSLVVVCDLADRHWGAPLIRSALGSSRGTPARAVFSLFSCCRCASPGHFYSWS